MKEVLFIIITFSLFGCNNNSSPKCTVEKVDFSGVNDFDTMKITCSSHEFVFESKETVFDTVKGFDIRIDHQVISPFCLKLKGQHEQSFLLTMEKPDFAGPVINLIDLTQKEPTQILSIQREPVEIFENENGNTFLVLQTISGEPGFYEDYQIVSIPLFELYQIKSGQIEKDSTASYDYNLNNFDQFKKISAMKNPVYGLKNGRKEIIDLN